ncbi:MAG: LLM class flavin-dependent oxidoreductase [Candidatus Ranarchaeia archaeon]
MRFGLGILANKPVNDLLEDALAAEEAGFDTVWVTDMAPIAGDRLPFSVLTLIAEHTEHVRIGTAVVSPYKWHPALLAEAVMTLDELAPKRVILGIGVGGLCLDHLNYKWNKPIRTIRETVSILRRMFSGETVNFDGQLFPVNSASLANPVSLGKDQPIYMAARRIQMVTLSGEISDGVILEGPISTVRWAKKQLAKGAKKGSRNPEKVDVGNWMSCSLAPDHGRAYNAVKEAVMFEISLSAEIAMELAGYPPGLSKTMAEKLSESQKDTSCVTDEMIKDFSISGNTKEFMDQLEKHEEAGLTHLLFAPPYGPAPREAIEILGKEIIPSFR